MQQLRDKYIAQLRALPLGDDKLPYFHAKLKLLEEVTGELRAVVAEFKFARPE